MVIDSLHEQINIPATSIPPVTEALAPVKVVPNSSKRHISTREEANAIALAGKELMFKKYKRPKTK